MVPNMFLLPKQNFPLLSETSLSAAVVSGELRKVCIFARICRTSMKTRQFSEVHVAMQTEIIG